MNEDIQKKFRETLGEKYLQRAFEAFAIYNYWGKKYANTEGQIKGLEEKMTTAEAEIKKINDLPDFHTVANKTKKKQFEADIKIYKARIQGVDNASKKVWEKAVHYQQEAIEAAEIADELVEFKLNTPDQIKEEQKKREAKEKLAEEAKVEEKPEAKV